MRPRIFTFCCLYFGIAWVGKQHGIYKDGQWASYCLVILLVVFPIETDQDWLFLNCCIYLFLLIKLFVCFTILADNQRCNEQNRKMSTEGSQSTKKSNFAGTLINFLGMRSPGRIIYKSQISIRAAPLCLGSSADPHQLRVKKLHSSGFGF
jgi:uncharacterized membrane protein YeiB